MPEQPLQLDELYDAIEQHIKDCLPELAYVGIMPDMLHQIDLPAVVVEVAEFESGEDSGTGQTALVMRFEARVIVAGETPDALKQAAHGAAQIAVLLRDQYWGLEVDAAKFERAAQDWTRPELDGYAVWVIEWTQGVELGEQEWPWPDQRLGTLVWGVYPETGAGHEADYVPVEQLDITT
ncbi:hypothetical protein IFR09_17075 [Pseudomonas syringae]|nr:hypothetical protein [Pseudomonas syringae]MBD8802297.1 hypothetical protein [Pseudomonas syringae]MBD8812878.1 hypothetical protein [Pseudomonas syringae]